MCESHYSKWRKYGDPLAGYSKRACSLDGLCEVQGCIKPACARGHCMRHYQALMKHGDALAARPKRADHTGCIRHDSYVVRTIDGQPFLEHVLVAEKAMGCSLPPWAVVHHVDEDPSNNNPSNLVVCPDQAYHMLIHRRMRALASCGNANWRKCCLCKQYDEPSNLRFAGISKVFHLACDAKRAREKRAAMHAQERERRAPPLMAVA